MEIGFLPPELSRWDRSKGDVLVIGVWSDLRPLRGPAGLVDWRLCGRLSQWIARGRVVGSEREQTLFPSERRLPWRATLAMGLGAASDFQERKFREALRRTLDALRGLGLRRAAMALPGRDVDRIPARRALELLLDLTAKEDLLDELTVIEPLVAQKEMAEVLRRRAFRPAAPPGSARP